MDNPCKNCDKANIHYVSDFEYGCDNPCQKAEDFYESISGKLESLLNKINELLEKTESDKNEY